MAAPVGNKFWEKRSKHGREKIFGTPEILWEAACEYFQWCQDNPFEEEDFIRSGDSAGKKVHLNRLRPFTLKGLCIFLGVHETYFNEFEKNNGGEDFSQVLTRIRDIIFDQKFSGAAAGFFNASIISRELGLADKSEMSVKTEQPLFPDHKPQKFDS